MDNDDRVLEEELEALVDKYDLKRTLSALERICQGKAEYLLEDWQDKDGARAWARAARAIERATVSEAVSEVS